MKTIKWVILLWVALGIQNIALGQDENLGRQYFENAEFEKAEGIYTQLSQKYPQNDYYFSRQIDCLVALKKYTEAEAAIKKQLKINPQNLIIYITYGDILKKQEKTEEADKQYKKAIEKLTNDRIYQVADAFTARLLYDLALATYQRGSEMAKDDKLYALRVADIYRLKGNEPKKMVAAYLDALEGDVNVQYSLQNNFQRYFQSQENEELQAQLYERIQNNPDFVAYNELLIWLLLQKKDYKAALRQTKALDRRLEENGARVRELARTAERESDFETAIEAFQYLLEKGETSTFFLDAQRGILRCKRENLLKGFSYTKADLETLDNEYEDFIKRYGFTAANATLICEQTNLEVFYLNNVPKAITTMDSLLKIPRLNPNVLGEAKISLGDYYLLSDEPWEATLLYSQVDKQFKDDPLGEMGRYKNAKLAYYRGDFEWAQGQLGVLKASTTELIANDALDLSVFIMDNLGLDTTTVSMELYAQADLLIFQNRLEEAVEKLEELKAQYPKGALDDDILYSKALIYEKQRNYNEAIKMYKLIVEQYKEEIRADNALFNMAQLYENQLKDKEQAKMFYEKIITDYTSSMFVTEARKRYRILRGDAIN
jgi:tetratricopeptide (TPR) repeat protein